MYSYIVIDDEPLIRRSIAKKIAGLALPLHWAGEAEDGEDGLRMIEELKPDIVLTDMRMPHTDGIALLQAMTATRSEAQIVVISGFSDFEYTKEAITASVAGYILKPFDSAELLAVLERAIERLESLRSNARRQAGLQEKLEMQALGDWLCRSAGHAGSSGDSRGVASPAAADYASPFARSLLGSERCAAALLVGGAASWAGEGVSWRGDEGVSERMKLLPLPDMEDAAVLVAWSGGVKDSPTRELRAALGMDVGANDWGRGNMSTDRREAAPSASPRLLAAVSADLAGPRGLPETVAELLALLENRPLGMDEGLLELPARSGSAEGAAPPARRTGGEPPANGTGQQLLQRGKPPQELPNHLLHGLLHALENANPQKAVSRFNGEFANWRYRNELTLGEARQRCIRLAQTIGEHLEHAESSTAAGWRSAALPMMLRALHGEKLRLSFEQWLYEHSGAAPTGGAKHELADQMRRYVDKRFNQPVTLEEMADRFFLHPSYASSLFKEKTGVTFQDYLKDIRLRHARGLLADTAYRIDRVAAMSGYDNVKYFYRLFKNETGMTPTAYREQHAGRTQKEE